LIGHRKSKHMKNPIWIENVRTGKKQTVFVTHRAGTDDWEGKPSVRAAIPRWSDLFVLNKREENQYEMEAVSGATPKGVSFSGGIQVPEGFSWNCWIEMNLAWDFNEAFPEFSKEAIKEDEFFGGQPALLYKANMTAKVSFVATPKLKSASIWDHGTNRIAPGGDVVTTTRNVFQDMKISAIKKKQYVFSPPYRISPSGVVYKNKTMQTKNKSITNTCVFYIRECLCRYLCRFMDAIRKRNARGHQMNS